MNRKPTQRDLDRIAETISDFPVPPGAPYSTLDVDDPRHRFGALVRLQWWAERLDLEVEPDPAIEIEELRAVVDSTPATPDRSQPTAPVVRDAIAKARAEVARYLAANPEAKNEQPKRTASQVLEQCHLLTLNKPGNSDPRHVGVLASKLGYRVAS